MTTQNDRYTATRLSAELGIDNRKMRDILTAVNPVEVKGQRKYYILRDVLPHVAKHVGAPNVIDINEARARKTEAEAEMAELELLEKKGDLLPMQQVVDTWLDMVAACRTKMLSMPAKLAPVVAVEEAPAVCKQIIEEQIIEALDEIASYITGDEEEDAADFDFDGGDSGSVEATADDDGEPVGGRGA